VTSGTTPNLQHKPADSQSLGDTGVDDYQPTARAITEHIGALKKSVGGGVSTPKAKGTPRPSATPKATPSKLSMFKTPTSSAKRKRTINNFSDDDEEDAVGGEDDSDAERKRLKSTPSVLRSTYSRRSKSVAKSYANDDNVNDDEDADAEAEEDHDRAAVRAPSAGMLNVQDDYFVGTAFDGADETVQLNQRVSKMGVAADADELTPQGKTATRRVFKRKIREDDSDISEFTPDF
jgi:hypothetical protein